MVRYADALTTVTRIVGWLIITLSVDQFSSQLQQVQLTVTESSTDPLTAPNHRLLTTNPPWTMSLTLTLDSVVGSRLDGDDYVIMLHIPLPAYVLTVNWPTHRPHLRVYGGSDRGLVELSVIRCNALLFIVWSRTVTLLTFLHSTAKNDYILFQIWRCFLPINKLQSEKNEKRA